MSSSLTNNKNIPARKDLRAFGIVLGLFLGLIAGFFYWKGMSITPIYITGALSALLIFAGVVFPHLLQSVYRIWMPVAKGVGWFNTRLILVLVFFLVFVPLGVIFRLTKWDPMKLRSRDPVTFWVAKDVSKVERKRYLKQF